MSSMNITKSKFMEYIRCNRYVALDNIHKRKKMDEALEDRYHDLLNTLENVTDDVFEEDFLEPDLSHLETMMPYFTDPVALHEFDSFEEGLATIQKNLKAKPKT